MLSSRASTYTYDHSPSFLDMCGFDFVGAMPLIPFVSLFADYDHLFFPPYSFKKEMNEEEKGKKPDDHIFQHLSLSNTQVPNFFSPSFTLSKPPNFFFLLSIFHPTYNSIFFFL